MKSSSLLLLGGGVTALVAGLFVAKKKSDATTDAIKEALRPQTVRPPATFANPAPPDSRATVAIHATGYWPFVGNLTATERKMEGGTKDRKSQPLHTLEDFQAGKAPFVSVAGDYTLWPYGQRVAISAWPGVVFRVVDTGGHLVLCAGHVVSTAGHLVE